MRALWLALALATAAAHAAEPDCAEPARAITGNDSPNKKYFEGLLEQGPKAPLKAFLKLWYPSGPEVNDFYIFACEIGPMLGLKLQTGEEVTPECKPDTLYSWGPLEKLQATSRNLPDNGTWTKWLNPGHGSVYTSPSAVATFGYGGYLIRYKIRESVPFTGDVDSMDGIQASTDWREYIVAQSKAVESWSSGTPEIYDEVVRDILRFASDKRVEPYPPPSEWAKDKHGKIPHGLARLYAEAMDKNVQNEPTLKRALLNLLSQIVHGEGSISYAPGVCRNRKLHYQTN